MLRMVQAKGAGYAMSKQQELETMQHVAHSTGLPYLLHTTCIVCCSITATLAGWQLCSQSDIVQI